MQERSEGASLTGKKGNLSDAIDLRQSEGASKDIEKPESDSVKASTTISR
jgi:hypothetical protein